jgi:hypothetical protein
MVGAVFFTLSFFYYPYIQYSLGDTLYMDNVRARGFPESISGKIVLIRVTDLKVSDMV